MTQSPNQTRPPRSNITPPPSPRPVEWNGEVISKLDQGRWIETLSNLNAFSLLNVSGGRLRTPKHQGGGPSIRLRLRITESSSTSLGFEKLLAKFQAILQKLFAEGDGTVRTEFTRTHTISSRNSSMRVRLIITFDGERPRTTEEHKERVERWYAEIIGKIKGLDDFSSAIFMNGKKTKIDQ